MTTFEGEPDGRGRRIAVVASRFNEVVTGKLVAACLETLRAAGLDEEDVDLAWVPGAFEIPLVARRMAESLSYDAVICLGAVVRGDTAHFELVANEAARGIREAARDSGVPVVFEVLATEDLRQALERAGGAHGNKGRDAALAALEMASLLDKIAKGGRQ
ncbi:MAG: 6,7-dimethyl-8-ribityllumazine synthase [Actinobacteria bacterium]|nr:6,7-dimethyl-8-ribityllumazine synthase [Actinomycetota bacterium]